MTSKVSIHRPAPAEAEKCTVCAEDGRPDELAQVWCVQCQISLCSACVPHHSRYNRSHVTMDVRLITNCSEVLQAEGHQCSVHGKQLDLLCFDCRLAKCTDCVRQCQSLGHTAPQLLKEPQADALLADAKESIKRLQMLVLGNSKKWVQSKDLVREVQLARAIHLDELKTKKNYAMDALGDAGKKIESALNEKYDRNRESAPGLQCLAEQLELSIRQASICINSLTHMSDGVLFLDQQAALMSRLQALSDELDSFKALPNIDQLVTMHTFFPEHLNKIFDSWMGSPKLSTDFGRVLAAVLTAKGEAEKRTSAQRQQLHFGRASSSFQLPFNCIDLSVTADGHVLVAAKNLGMREYDVSGHELSGWRPQALNYETSDKLKRVAALDDEVWTVAALDDGRAVVGVFISRLLVLLQRSSADRAAWIVEKRVAELHSSPRILSVLGDVVAVYCDRGLQLVRLSSGQTLYSDSRAQEIHGLALTVAGVVTAGTVTLSYDRTVDVVECYSHRGERLWRHELVKGELVGGICAAPARQLLMCVYGMSWRSMDCVRAINREDGKKVKDVLVDSSHGVTLPMRLSLSRAQQQQVLAVLSQGEATTGCSQWNKVTVHAAVSS